MFIVELVVDEGSGKMMALGVTKMERDPAAPHCTILHLAQPAVREIPGQPPFRFQSMSVRSEQIRGWFEGEILAPQAKKETASVPPDPTNTGTTSPSGETPATEATPPGDSPPTASA